MRKKSLILSTCLCLVLSLTACGSKKTDTKEGVTETPSVTEAVTPEATPEATGEATPEVIESNVTVELGQYKGLEVTVMPTEVTDDEVQEILDSFNEAYGTAIPVDKKVVEDKDIVNIDYVGKIDGKEFDGGSAKGFSLTIGSGQFIEGFESGLIGKNVGDTVDVNCTFPENYVSSDLAGKDAVFTVTINFIDSGEKEPLSDAVVAANDTNGNKTVEEYREFIKSSLKSSKEYSANSQKQIDIMQKAIDNATFTGLNQAEIDQFVSEMTSDYENVAQTYGFTLEDYISYSFGGLSLEEFYSEIAKASEFNIRQKYLLEEVAKAENIVVSDEEYENIITEYMEYSGETDKDKVVTDLGGEEVIRNSILFDKASAIILESAVVVTE